MTTYGMSQQPATLSPHLLTRLIMGLTRIQMIYRQDLRDEGIVLVVQDRYITLFEGLYSLLLEQRRGVILPSGTGKMAVAATVDLIEGTRGLDVLVPISDIPDEAEIDIREALELAQKTGREVVPVGIACGTCWPFLRHDVPLPGARTIAQFEAPFVVPEQPADIPSTWVETILRLLKAADGRAKDRLATWRKYGNPDS